MKNVQFSLFELFFFRPNTMYKKSYNLCDFLLSKICNWWQKNIINSLMLHMHFSVFLAIYFSLLNLKI